MKFNKILKKSLGAALLGGAAVLMSAEAGANIPGRWVQHPGACLRADFKESQIDRMFEGERYVYFSIRGYSLDRNTKYQYTTRANFDPIHIFRYDKQTSWSNDNIVALGAELELSGSLPIVMNYSVDKGVLVVIYENMMVDFVYDDGTLISSSAIKAGAVPTKAMRPYSITFDADQPLIYVAGSFGYATIDLRDGELKSIKNFDKELGWAGRVGDKMVVFAGEVSLNRYATSTYIFPVDDVPYELTGPIAGADNLQALMPLTANSFAAMAPGSTDQQYSVKLFVSNGGNVQSQTIVETSSVDGGALPRYRHFFRTDGYVAEAKDGYVVHNSENLTFIKKGLEYSDYGSLAAYKNAAVRTVSKASLTSTEKYSKSSSFDGSRLYLFTYESIGHDGSDRGFYFKDITSSGSWGAKSQLAAPNVPGTNIAAYAQWHPHYGLIIRGPGPYFSYEDGGPDILCSYKDGVWKELSYAANFTDIKYHNITSHGKEIGIDPLNPNWIWGCSVLAGLSRIDTGDYSNFFGLGSLSHKGDESKYPGYYALLPNSSYAALANFSNVDFDNNNVMWFVRHLGNTGHYYDYEDVTEAYTPLYYFTPEERMELGAGKVPPIHEIRIPRAYSNHDEQVVAMKYPGNDNYIAMSHRNFNSYDRQFILYDHRGTLSDTSDDRWTFFNEMFDDHGDKIKYLREKFIFEDPMNGEFWLCTDNGPFIFNPTEVLDGNKVCRRLRISKRMGSPADEAPFEQLSIVSITVDKFNRKWLATDQGLFCLSPDNQELLAHYTVDNSPLPCEEVLAVTSNPETGAIYVLTTRGMAEFQPEGYSGSLPAGTHLSIWPSTVTPDFNGHVSLSGAVSGTEYVVTDENEDEVCSLGTPDNGQLQWDVRDAQGERVPAGRYNISRRNVKEQNRVVVNN